MKNLLSALIAATVMFVGCTDDDDDDDIIVDDTPDIPGDDGTGDTPIELGATILGTGPYNFISGVGRVQIDSPQSFTAEIEIRSDNAGAVRAWHVHFGNCASGGGIVGPPEAYRPLVIDPDGTDAVSVVVPFGLDVNAQYHMNVHISPEDLTIIACGDLL